jgi:hypothetical protein
MPANSPTESSGHGGTIPATNCGSQFIQRRNRQRLCIIVDLQTSLSHGEVLKVSKAEGLRQIRIKILPILNQARV